LLTKPRMRPHVRPLVRALVLVSSLLLPSIALAAPRIFYTDILSGPNTGGEDNRGAYVTIVGRGFGASRGSSKVFIGGVEAAAYKQWSDTAVSIQPGGAVTGGAVTATVSGDTSNADHSFTVRAGKIYFVALNGNDSWRSR